MIANEVTITPPLDLVREWQREANHNEAMFPQVASLAAQWGADQELEACVDALNDMNPGGYWSQRLRTARRLKPPSLKEKAIAELDKVDMLWDTTEFSQETLHSLDTIRRALESIPEDQ